MSHTPGPWETFYHGDSFNVYGGDNLVVLALPALVCGLPDSGWVAPTPEPMDAAAQHSIDRAACSRECGGDADCTNVCVGRGE